MSRLDVVAIGNALVDVLSHESHQFLADHHLTSGAMELIDTERAEHLYGAMGPAVEISGGSAANTLVGVTSLGGSAAFIGRVADDDLGTVFGHDIRAAGVEFVAKPAVDGEPSGRCLIMVTPDAQRTMSTFLGASVRLGPADVDRGLIARGKILYLEGYLFDPPEAQEAFRAAAAVAHGAGRKVALTLSDPFCVERHRAAFLDLVEHHVDILFANELEICALYQVPDFDAALPRVRGHCDLAALTRSAKGSVLVNGKVVHAIPAHPVATVVDTTGAGDLYAAGVLYGLSQGLDLPTCGRLGSLAAAEVIAHVGARPMVPLIDLAASVLG